ncbi:hypothetical protein I4U23_017918 [Adineta vaga]|nr:hypothetical protein I4U23_017918 [Adineta vaga]
MGALCSCGTGEKLSTEYVKPKLPIVLESNNNQTSDLHKSTTNIHSSEEILNDTLQTEIIKAIDEHVATIPSAYQTERDRIVNEMRHSESGTYLGLVYADYPDVNGPEVNKMAHRLVASNDVKQRLIDQIDKRIDPIFLSRTSTWNPSSSETARPMIRVFIEKNVNNAFNHLKLD